MNDKKQKILIVGGGGREHALAWRCAHEGHEVIAAPGSDAIAAHATCVAVSVSDFAGLVSLAKEQAVDFVIVGPEQPLVDGLADALRDADIPVVGPSKAAAALEASKADAKAFMAKFEIPTAKFVTVSSLNDGLSALRTFESPPVVKASGLAAGKGVIVCDSFTDAEQALRECISYGRFGEAGATVVLEERLHGEEASFFAITDGTESATLMMAQDHKRLRDGDEGPNTGGMGAYTPAFGDDQELRERIEQEILAPTLKGLREEGRPFVGVLFIGLMVDESGAPKVIEYNVRFGDPETQALMLGLDEPVVPSFAAAARGELKSTQLKGSPAAVVVMASAGYPQSSTKGVEIEGLDNAMDPAENSVVFHAGSIRSDDLWLTNAGRVLGVTAKGDTVEAAVERAYRVLATIRIEGGQNRSDIGSKSKSNA